MANLKDTIVLGNLTVTGKVVASDILNTNGNPNRFETIYANKIVGQGENYTLEIEAIAENGTMKITTGLLEVNGPLQINTIQTKTGSGLEISSDSTLQLNATSNIDLISDGNTLKISGDTVVPDGVVQLGTSQKFFDRAYIDSIRTDKITPCNSLTLSVGGSNDSAGSNLILAAYKGTQASTGNVFFNGGYAGMRYQTVATKSGNSLPFYDLNLGESVLVMWNTTVSGAVYGGTSFVTRTASNTAFENTWQPRGSSSNSWKGLAGGHSPDSNYTIQLMTNSEGRLYFYSYGPSATIHVLLIFLGCTSRIT